MASDPIIGAFLSGPSVHGEASCHLGSPKAVLGKVCNSEVPGSETNSVI